MLIGLDLAVDYAAFKLWVVAEDAEGGQSGLRGQESGYTSY